MSVEVQEILDFLLSANDYLISTHINADGDAYASVLSMAYFLEKLDKKYQIIIEDQKLDSKYQFLWGFDKIQSYSDKVYTQFGAAVILDVPNLKRLGKPSKFLPSADYCVQIDHHPLEEKFAKYSFVDANASSTSLLVYELISKSNVEITSELANLLFTGIMYDTGRFSFSNTTQRDFEVAAELLKKDVSPSEVSNHLFFNNSFEAMKIVGYGLANMQSFLDGRVCIIHIPRHIMNEDYNSEIEELTNFSIAIKDVEVGLFIREVKPNFFKVSFRSKGRVNVNSIAKIFGGGGHIHAAGCRYEGDFQKLCDKLIKEIEKQLKNLEK